MTLPRFTSGRVGNLEFSHLNEAFDMLDGKQAKKADRRETQSVPLLVRLISRNPAGAFSWAEVSRDNDGTYAPVQGGLTSTKNSDPFHYQAISLSGGGLVGDIVVIEPRRTKQGRLYYTIGTSAGTVTRAFVIVSNVPHATRQDSWTYIGKTVESVVSPGIGQQWSTTSQVEYTLLNGAENPVDGSTIGVGTIPPSGTVSGRRPIKPATVVLASNIGGDWIFSLPNGYAFTCQ